MSRRSGPTLAERGVLSAATATSRTGATAQDERDRPRPVVTRHCWVTGLPDYPGRWAGLLAEWRQESSGRWWGRVVYAVDDGGRAVLVEAWVDAGHLTPA